jgi:hypothetical protein
MTQRQVMSPDDTQPAATPIELARGLICKTLGVGKVAEWCAISENAVYQWFTRATDAAPIPPAHVLSVVHGAFTSGQRFDIAILWPAWRELRL